MQAEPLPAPAVPEAPPAAHPKDRYWWIPIVISGLALLVSGLSAYFSHNSLGEAARSREVNEVTGRAYVTLSALLIDTGTLYKRPVDDFHPARPDVYDLMGYLTVTNTGKTAAKLVRIERAILGGTNGKVGTRFDGGIEHISDIHELAPGVSQTVRMNIPVVYRGNLFDHHERRWSIDFTVAYGDGIHQGDQVDSPMLCAVIPDKPQKVLVTAYTCNQEIYEVHEPAQK